MGLYMLNTMALPTPSSARFRNERIDRNSPFRPKYCTPRQFSIMERMMKGITMFSVFSMPSNRLFRAAFFVR